MENLTLVRRGWTCLFGAARPIRRGKAKRSLYPTARTFGRLLRYGHGSKHQRSLQGRYSVLSRSGLIGEEAITGHSVANVVKRYAGRAGLSVADFSGHSLRAGFVTSAADRGADPNQIMDVSRHVDPRTVRTYIRRADRYKDHAGSGFL